MHQLTLALECLSCQVQLAVKGLTVSVSTQSKRAIKRANTHDGDDVIMLLCLCCWQTMQGIERMLRKGQVEDAFNSLLGLISRAHGQTKIELSLRLR